MQPFWAGTQRSGDALGLVIYRGRDLAAAEVTHVQSHFVLRRTADIWLDGKRLTMPEGTAAKPAEVPIPAARASCCAMAAPRSASACRGACAGCRKAGNRDLVDDGNAWNCLRLTVDHGRVPTWKKAAADEMAAGAAFWVRVGSDLTRDADFDAWRKEFRSGERSLAWR